MGDSEGTTEEKKAAESEPDATSPASAPFRSAPSNIPPSEGRPAMRRSSIRPAPPSFKPTTRDSAKLPPPMVIHSGEADESAPAWGAPELPSHPSQVNVAKLSRVEPFALAEDLNLAAPRAYEETLPFVFPRDGGIPQEAESFAARVEPEANAGEPALAPDSSEVATLSKNDAPVPVIAAPATSVAMAEQLFAEPIRVAGTTEPSAHKKRVLPIVIALAVFGGCIAVLSGGLGTPHVAAPERVAPSAQPSRTDDPPAKPAEAKPAEAKPAEAKPAEAKPAEAKPAEAKPAEAKPESAAAAATASTAEPAAKTVHVRLVLNPPDSKLVHNGVLVQGPPYEFDIPRGKRLSFEASHRGYVTRRVTLDASKPLFQIGLMAEPKKRR